MTNVIYKLVKCRKCKTLLARVNNTRKACCFECKMERLRKCAKKSNKKRKTLQARTRVLKKKSIAV